MGRITKQRLGEENNGKDEKTTVRTRKQQLG